MKAVMYGAGNIGRGFVGALFSRSGYEVVFIDVARPVVLALKERRGYPVRVVSSDGFRDEQIGNVTAIDANDAQAVADAIARADIMATAVGVNALKFVAPNIAAGLSRRFAEGGRPLNIIICENLLDADKLLAGMIRENLSAEERDWFDRKVGMVEASIGRMVPVQTPEMQDGDPLRVCVESYDFLPVDGGAFKGEIPRIRNMIPCSPFGFYIQRKLFIHNMGHATCAYLGMLRGLTYIYEAVGEPDIQLTARCAMQQSMAALCEEYQMDPLPVLRHIDDLLIRFSNTALMDTCARVGGDPARKLQATDRLVGAALLCDQHGIVPSHIAIGIAGALRHYLNAEGISLTIQNAGQALSDLSGLAPDHSVVKLALAMFEKLDGGLPALLRLADLARKSQVEGV